ncbi:MAG: uracil-DNA glycosylase family 4 [Candidatus Promineifilaceae bacterium]|jgi:uracil-DNA glycosylase family 4
MALEKILDAFSGYLRHEIEEGRGRVDIDPAALNALRNPQPAVSPASRPATGNAAPGTTLNSMQAIARDVDVCTRCDLCKARTRTVPGQGSQQPEIAFIGDVPGQDEDQQGQAFVGRAGDLLTKMITAMGYTRDDVWIGTIVKCRPPKDRTPTDHEIETCSAYLKAQLAALQPKVIICLGATATNALLGTSHDISALRGHWQSYDGIHVMPTFHPELLLRDETSAATKQAKRNTWEDLQAVLKKLGRSLPAKNK